METKPHNIKEQILSKIRGHELSMRPRAYFVFKVAALAVVVLAVLAISIFIFNFILFSIRISRGDLFLGFGPRGFQAFLAFFPWDLFIIDAALIALLGWLVRQFSFGYKKPVLFLLAGLILFTGIFAVVLDRGTSVNDHFLREADKHHLPPPVGAFYINARRLPPQGSGVCRECIVISINGNTLRVQDARNASSSFFTIMLPKDDPRATTSNIKIGDVLFIAGDREGGTIRAFGIRQIQPAP